MNRCKAIKGDSENAKNSMDVLLHTAAFGADDDALAYEIGDGPDLGMRQLYEEHRPGIGRSHHAQRDPARERRHCLSGPSNPIGRHETEFQLPPIQQVCIMNAGITGLPHAPIRFRAPAVEKLRDGRTLSIESSAVLGRAYS